MSDLPKDNLEKKTDKPARRKNVRFADLFYYYFDFLIKVLAEGARDVVFFFQRVLAGTVAQIFTVIAVFFNPLSEGKPLLVRIGWGVPRVALGIILLTALSLIALTFFLIGGTFSGLLGFRNIVDYSLKEQIAAWLGLIIILLILPHFTSEFTLYKISLFFCLTLILVGFNFLYGQCGILTLGHAGFVSMGGFITAFLYTGSFGFKLPFVVSTFIAAFISFLVGLLLGLPSLRVKDYYLVIVTLAFMLAIPQIWTSKYMADYTGLSLGGLSIDQVSVPSVFHWMAQPTWNYFFVVGIALALIIFAYNLMHHSPIGRAFRTIKCDVEISTILGIPVITYKLLAFAMSAFYASVAGSLIMYLNRFISADSYTVNDSIDYIVAAVVGGPESILGCTLGGLFLTFQRDISAAMGTLILGGNHLTRMFYGIFMILVVFIAPRGIAGEITRSLKSRLIQKPQRGKYYTSPPPDYDFLDMKGTTIKEE